MIKSKTSKRPPRMCLQKSTGRAYVRLDGQWRTLGPHGSEEALAAYDRLIAEWLLNGRPLPKSQSETPTINELIPTNWKNF